MALMTETANAAPLDRCSSLQTVAGRLKGDNNIDIDACTKRPVMVTIVSDLLTEPTAEFAIGLSVCSHAISEPVTVLYAADNCKHGGRHFLEARCQAPALACSMAPSNPPFSAC